MDAVAARVRADQHQAVARALRPGPHEAIHTNQADAHRVHQRVVRVALLEIDLAAHRGDTDAVAVAADAGDDALDMVV